MEEIIKEIIKEKVLDGIIKMLIKDGLLSDNVSSYLINKGLGGLLAALLSAAGSIGGTGGSITLWTTTTVTTSTVAAPGIWGWLGFTTVASTTAVATTTVPVTAVVAVGVFIGLGIYKGIYKAYQYSQRDEATIKEYSKLCNYEWNKLYRESPSNEILSQVADYMYNYGGKIDSKSKMENINDAVRIIYIASFSKKMQHKLKFDDAIKLATTLVRSEREKRIQYSPKELENFLLQIP